LLEGSEIIVVKLDGVGGHTTAGKFVENLLLERSTLRPLAANTTAAVEMIIRAGR
jgi:hypothetical protein